MSIRVRRRGLAGLFSGLPHNGVTGLALDDAVLRVSRRAGDLRLPLIDIAQRARVERRPFGSVMTLPLTNASPIVLRGAHYRQAVEFAQRLDESWMAFNLVALERERGVLEGILAGLDTLESAQEYASACKIEPIYQQAFALQERLLSKLAYAALEPAVRRKIERIEDFVAKPDEQRQRAITAFVESELVRFKEFFDTVESKPLTEEQRLSVVVDEDATLVLAGAGSGKTSVITAKAAYLVKAGIRKPEEVLLLAFAKNAAQEMSERIATRTGVPVVARTFHALAYDIIGAVEGSKPALAEHASDDLAFTNLIKAILRELVERLNDVSHAIISWFSQFLAVSQPEWDFAKKADFYAHLKAADLRTLQGERVKSYEELLIANWLFQNGIAYEYEPLYEHELPKGSGRREYCPDFRLTESGIYIEHFGVRRQKQPDGQVAFTTAPFVDRAQYLKDMTWKRELHAEKGTTLIETYSYERQEGNLLSALEEKLAPHVELKPRPILEIYDRVVDLKQVDSFSQMLGTFLRKFKNGSYTISACEASATKLKLGERAKAFLTIFAPVYDEYQRRLGQRIDFEDMVLRASRYVETGLYISPFRHILVDEFQDISQGRARLVQALKAQHADARLFGVGDDWQSIFRFAGSDLHLMRNFGMEFGGTFVRAQGVHRIVDLGRTFRSVDQIAYAAQRFVLKNKAQLSKTIIPAGVAETPAFRVAHVKARGEQAALEAVLSDLSNEASGSKPSVLLLGRYRFVAPDMPQLQRKFPRLQLSYKTIHASKGLEADHVILLSANSGAMGFPSEIVDDPLLDLVSPTPEQFAHAEERRVMYVALTRARKTFTMVASQTRPSQFVTELQDDPANSFQGEAGAKARTYSCGECGGRFIEVSDRDGRLVFLCEHTELCGNRVAACPNCENDLPVAKGLQDAKQCSCSAVLPSCPKCKDGWLVERTGKYGAFHSCVRFPLCDGKAQSSTKRRSQITASVRQKGVH